MAEELVTLLKKAMSLPAEEREALASALVASLGGASGEREDAWITDHRKKALAGLKKSGRAGFMEASFRIAGGLPYKPQSDLLRAAEHAAIHAFGWPIGVVLHNENRPRPMSEGIVAEIDGIDYSYDYWALRTQGDFFFLGSLFEDERAKGAIWFDTRIMRVTETCLFCYRLYKALGAAETTRVTITIRHGGLGDRTLGSAKPGLWAPERISHEDEVEWKKTIELASLRAELKQTVKESLSHLWILFDFFQPMDQQIFSAVDEFLGMVGRQQKPFEV
jgi:hypothetical protein